MTIDEKVIPWIISLLIAAISLAGYLSLRKRNKELDVKSATNDAKKDAGEDTSVKMDIKYIMRGVDDIRVEQRSMREEMGSQAERITRCEENCKSAHKRIDEHISKGE